MQDLTFNHGDNKSNRGDRLLTALTQFDDDFIDVLAQDLLTPQALQDRTSLLVTNNVNEFERVTRLKMENWSL